MDSPDVIHFLFHSGIASFHSGFSVVIFSIMSPGSDFTLSKLINGCKRVVLG